MRNANTPSSSGPIFTSPHVRRVDRTPSACRHTPFRIRAPATQLFVEREQIFPVFVDADYDKPCFFASSYSNLGEGAHPGGGERVCDFPTETLRANTTMAYRNRPANDKKKAGAVEYTRYSTAPACSSTGHPACQGCPSSSHPTALNRFVAAPKRRGVCY